MSITGQHKGVGHARHGQVRIGFSATVTGDRYAHQSSIKAILQVATKHSVLDEDIACGGVALIVHVQRTPAIRQAAIVDDRDPLGRDTLANAP